LHPAIKCSSSDIPFFNFILYRIDEKIIRYVALKYKININCCKNTKLTQYVVPLTKKVPLFYGRSTRTNRLSYNFPFNTKD